jgi:four helix bundle suffix protein
MTNQQPYKKLYTYWFSVMIYDHTVKFCDNWIRSWKLKEQMTGAARSGKQNIVEGTDDMGTSLKIAIKLTGTSKGSFEELIGDLEDFLRQRDLTEWGKDDSKVLRFRKIAGGTVKKLSETRDLRYLKAIKFPERQEVAANWLLTLCHQATFLLHRQVEALKRKHEQEGGFTEQLYKKRINYRNQNGYLSN